MNRLYYYDKTLNQWVPFTANDAQTLEGKSASELYDDLAEQLTGSVESQISEKLNYNDDINASLKLKGTFPIRDYPVANSYAGLQGCTKVGNKLYVTLSRTVENGTALLMEIDYDSFTLLRSAELPLYHANDIAYNPSYNGKAVLLVPHTSTDAATPNKITIVDIATLTVLEDKILSAYVYNLSYDQINDKYIGFGSVSSATKLYVFSNNFTLLNTYDIETNGNVPQGSEVYDKYYIGAYTKQNSLYLYNEGKLVKKFAMSDGYGELESCVSLGNGELLLGFNFSKTNEIAIQFYKANLFKTTSIANNNQVNGNVPYALKEQSVDIYLDCNYSGNDSDGSQTKPFKKFADTYSVLPTSNCYVDLFVAPGTYPEKVVFQYFAGVNIYIQNSNPGGGEVKIFSISANSFLGEIVTNGVTIYGTNNKLLTSTNNAIELVNVFKFRRINTKITNELNTTNSRGIRTSMANVVDEGSLESNNCVEAMQFGDNSDYSTSSTATFSFTGNTTILDVRDSNASISSAFATAMGSSYATSNGGKINRWDTIADGALPTSTGDVITVVKDYVSKGYKSGRILFSTGATNLPTAWTSAMVSFETFEGSSSIYLRAINFSITATKVYFGQISGTTITWKYATLA